MQKMDIKTFADRPLTRVLDLNLLELFECIYHTRNLTLAGERLGLSQPAVSRALAKLRCTYGDVLFVRQQRGVLPTPLAEQLIGTVAGALAMLRATVAPAHFNPSADSRLFRVAMSDIGERMFLPRLQAYLSEHAPGVAREALAPARETLAAQLASGEVDLCVAYMEGLGKAVETQRLFVERYVHIARVGHPALKGAGRLLSVEQLRSIAHAVASPPGTLHGTGVERALLGKRVQATIALRVKSFLGLGPIVAQTDLLATLPNNLARLVAQHMGLQVFESPLPLGQFDVSMMWHRRLRADPGGQWLHGVFLELFGERKASQGLAASAAWR